VSRSRAAPPSTSLLGMNEGASDARVGESDFIASLRASPTGIRRAGLLDDAAVLEFGGTSLVLTTT
jgi:hypothetical protein